MVSVVTDSARTVDVRKMRPEGLLGHSVIDTMIAEIPLAHVVWGLFDTALFWEYNHSKLMQLLDHFLKKKKKKAVAV